MRRAGEQKRSSLILPVRHRANAQAPFTTLLLRPVALFASLNWASPACCCTLGGATERSPGGIYMTTVVLNRRNLLAAGGAVLATGVSGLLLPARAEGLAPTDSMSGGANNY